LSTLPNVLILSGGLSHERDVSLRSGRRVAEILRAAGCEVSIRDVDSQLLPALEEHRPDVVWPLLHGASGEDGVLRDVLSLLRIPYVGARPYACRRAFDKPVAKTVAQAAGLSTPTAVALPHDVFRELGAPRLLDAIVARFGLPLVVKPARGGSALGVTMVAEADALPGAMMDAYSYGDVALVERAVLGREVAVSVIDTGDGPRALPAVEISMPPDAVYDYSSRYTAGVTEYFTPARLDDATAAAVGQAALTAHTALGLRDLSRTDLIVDGDGVPWFLETNVAPGMTELSLLPQAITANGEDLGEVYLALVRAAHARPLPA
jgi:D-alanine-D-alanine ligase